MNPDVADLIERSNRLGSDKRITNFAGGNTSAKVALQDPVTGDDVVVLFVKGSGGDLGTLKESGLAKLVLDRVRGLERLHTAGTHEDDIVAYYQHCSFADGGAVPSIDTPLHAFVRQAHVDHLHPDSMIALAAAADGPALVQECFGDTIGWLDWLRPGFQLGLAIRDFQTAHPEAEGVMMGGHGMMVWADTSAACEALSLRVIEQAEQFLARRGKADPFGAVRPALTALPAAERAAQVAVLAPVVRGIASADRRVVGHFTDVPVVLEFLAAEAAPRMTALGTSCPDHFLRTKVKPLYIDVPAGAPVEEKIEALHVAHTAYRADYQAYYDAYAEPTSPAIRGADPAIVLVPGVGMWSFGADSATARVAGEFYINAINVMRGAEAVSSYAPISDHEKFRIEYWELEERKLRMRPPAPPLQGQIALVTGGASGIGLSTVQRLRAGGACVVIADRDIDAAEKAAAAIGHETALAIAMDVSDEAAVIAGFAAASARFGGVDIVVNNAGFARSSALVDTTVEEWDALHDVLAKGAFLVSREGARVMLAQGRGGDIVYVVSKNSVVAGPKNIAYSAAKADQAHQVRLLAAELAEFGIRVNAVNPDAVVKGSGIFSGEWLEQRAAAYKVAPEDLGKFYASRTLLGEEVLPEHIAAAVAVLVEGALARTTGLTINVDGGLAAAFLR